MLLCIVYIIVQAHRTTVDKISKQALVLKTGKGLTAATYLLNC